jgi:hypothetical protein
LFPIRILLLYLFLSLNSSTVQAQMTSSVLQKSPCKKLGKAVKIFKYLGCLTFCCGRHATERRQTLGKQMDESPLDHDQLRRCLTEDTTESRDHPLTKHIDGSINTIHQADNNARLDVDARHTSNTMELGKAKKDMITPQISTVRQDDCVPTLYHRQLVRLPRFWKQRIQSYQLVVGTLFRFNLNIM